MEPSSRQLLGCALPGCAAEILDLSKQADTGRVVRLAAELLRAGKLVAAPTETVYGLLANADLPEAVERLSRVKGRADDRPYTHLIPDVAILEADRTKVPPRARRLISRFWPGPLTLVLRTEGGWRGYRLPDHALVREILRTAGCRVVAPSANRSGSKEPLTAQDVARELGSEIELILDGGPCRIGRPSTVVRVDKGRCEVLREGAIGSEEIERAWGSDTHAPQESG
jgi:L-threonylcarbamoyladenylate synthase